MAVEIRWEDKNLGRKVFMRPGLLADAADALDGEGWKPFELLTTERALGDAPELGAAAAKVHIVPSGQVPDAAAAVIDDVSSTNLVALGGGRVIDAAKAVAAARGGRVAAVPSTLSGAEMTEIHRMPAGSDSATRVRPALVLADAHLMTSLPEPDLRATAMNALAHAADSLYTPRADDASRKNALRGAKLIADSLRRDPGERDPGDLALGALVSAQAIDASGLSIHHVMSQTTVRVCETPHAETNAAFLPVVMKEMTDRAPEHIEALADALGTVPSAVRGRIEELAGRRHSLGELGADESRRDAVIDAAMKRSELVEQTPGEVTREDIARILDHAW